MKTDKSLRYFKHFLLLYSAVASFFSGSALPNTALAQALIPLDTAETAPVFFQTSPILKKAALLYDRGDGLAAKAIYTAYLKQDANNLEATLGLAKIEQRQFNFASAEATLKQALAKHPQSAETMALLGQLYTQWSKLPENWHQNNPVNKLALAKEYLTQAKILAPNNPLVLAHFADAMLAANDWVSAEKLLKKAYQINSNHRETLQTYAKLYLASNEGIQAKNSIFHAIEIDPQNSENFYLLARLMESLDQPTETLKYAKRSEKQDFGTNPFRDELIAKTHQQLGSYSDAIAYYKRLLAHSPNDTEIRQKIAVLYQENNQPKESIQTYQELVKINPDFLSDLIQQARTLSRQEKILPAISEWEKLLAIVPNNPELSDEAFSTLSGLVYLNYFYQTGSPVFKPENPAKALPPKKSKRKSSKRKSNNIAASNLASDIKPLTPNTPFAPGSPQPLLQERILAIKNRFGNANTSALKDKDKYTLNAIKLEIALQGDLTPALTIRLDKLADSQQAAIAAEANFLRGNIARAKALLDVVDGLSDEALMQLADRLFFIQELQYSELFYRRLEQLVHDANFQPALQHIEKKRALAKRMVQKGDRARQASNYQAAVSHYLTAASIDRESANVFLKLGDSYEQLKQWKNVKLAFDQAVALSPSIKRSAGFSKHYQKISKKAR